MPCAADHLSETRRRVAQGVRIGVQAGLLSCLAGLMAPAAFAQMTCLEIKSVQTRGVSLLPEADVRQALSPFEEQCLGLADLNGVLQAVTTLYVDAGYVAARAYLPEQDLSDGQLEIAVVEGELSQITFNGRRDRRWERHVFTGLVGKPVHLREVEQGLDLIRAMPGYQARMELAAGETAGQSVLEVAAQTAKPWQVRLATNNHGLDNDDPGQSASTGQYIDTLDMSYTHALGRNETWTLSLSKSVPDHPFNLGYSGPGSRSLEAGVSMPFGRTVVGASFGYSDYDTVIPGAVSLIDLEGRTRTATVTVDHLLHRDRDSKTLLKARLQRKDSETQIAGVRIGASSRVLTGLRLGLSHERALWGGQAVFDLGFEQGLEWFGAEDAGAQPEGQPNAQFLKWEASASYARGFRIGTESFAYRGQFLAQYSDDLLYGGQQVNLGGQSSVRGVKAAVISGSSGAVLRNEVSWMSMADLDRWGRLQPYATLDLGTIARQSELGISGGNVVGASIGMRLIGGPVSLDVSYGRLLSVPGDMARPDGALMMSVSTVF